MFHKRLLGLTSNFEKQNVQCLANQIKDKGGEGRPEGKAYVEASVSGQEFLGH